MLSLFHCAPVGKIELLFLMITEETGIHTQLHLISGTLASIMSAAYLLCTEEIKFVFDKHTFTNNFWRYFSARSSLCFIS